MSASATLLSQTPTLHSKTPSKLTGANIYLKFENLQFTAAYKERGALNALLLMPEEARSRGVIAASAGNHAQGLSYHGTRLGVPVTIVMPKSTPTVKVMQTEAVGGKVVLEGEKFDDAYKHARLLEKELGLTFVHPFDDPTVAAGQALSLSKCSKRYQPSTHSSCPSAGRAVVGHGYSGTGINPDIELVGVQAELYPSMYALLNDKQMPCEGDTLAEGIAVKVPGEFTSEVIRDIVDDIILVSEPELETAVSLLLQIEKTVVEGGGAAGLAAVDGLSREVQGQECRHRAQRRQYRHPPACQCAAARSGSFGPPRSLADHLTRPSRCFAKVMKLFNEHNINIIEIYHQRIFTTLPAKGLITDIECEARDAEQLQGLVDSLKDAGYKVERVELN
ncbi:MAG: pyridoxal-phosphate dependent enzyme [Sphingomonadales bacterium]|nr:pyridoxal-phosphate dependent enzyme [Sphingomonadales bacterium]